MNQKSTLSTEPSHEKTELKQNVISWPHRLYIATPDEVISG